LIRLLTVFSASIFKNNSLSSSLTIPFLLARPLPTCHIFTHSLLHPSLTHSPVPYPLTCPLPTHLPLTHSPTPYPLTCPLPTHPSLTHSPAPYPLTTAVSGGHLAVNCIISDYISSMVINIFMSPRFNGTRNHLFSKVSLLSKFFPFFYFNKKKKFSDLY